MTKKFIAPMNFLTKWIEAKLHFHVRRKGRKLLQAIVTKIEGSQAPGAGSFGVSNFSDPIVGEVVTLDHLQ